MVPALTAVALGSALALSARAITYNASDASAYFAGDFGVAPNQTYVSRPDLTPPAFLFLTNSSAASSNYTLLSYRGSQTKQPAPLIVDSAGELVWIGSEIGQSMGLMVQEYFGEPVLTMFEGTFSGSGYGSGYYPIITQNYSNIANYTTLNQTADTADFHEFHILPQAGENQTALVESWRLVSGVNLSTTEVPNATTNGWTFDCVFQEIELRTNSLLFEWRSLEHIPIEESYFEPTAGSAHESESDPFDQCHINAMDKGADGNYLVSLRGPSAVYNINATDGSIIWRLGGKDTNFTMGTNATFWYQHNPRYLSDVTTSPFYISLFDNAEGGGAPAEAEARGLILEVDTDAMTAEVYAEYFPSFDNVAGSQGSMTVGDETVFIGWGASPYYSEYNKTTGELLRDVAFGNFNATSIESYRAYSMQWTGTPLTVPDLGIADSDVYASWNGATEVATWSLMAGTSASSLTSVTNATRTGFETAITGMGSNTYVAVAALDADGACLGVSTVYSVGSSAYTSTAGSCPNGTIIATTETSSTATAVAGSSSSSSTAAATTAATTTSGAGSVRGGVLSGVLAMAGLLAASW